MMGYSPPSSFARRIVQSMGRGRFREQVNTRQKTRQTNGQGNRNNTMFRRRHGCLDGNPDQGAPQNTAQQKSQTQDDERGPSTSEKSGKAWHARSRKKYYRTERIIGKVCAKGLNWASLNLQKDESYQHQWPYMDSESKKGTPKCKGRTKHGYVAWGLSRRGQCSAGVAP